MLLGSTLLAGLKSVYLVIFLICRLSLCLPNDCDNMSTYWLVLQVPTRMHHRRKNHALDTVAENHAAIRTTSGSGTL